MSGLQRTNSSGFFVTPYFERNSSMTCQDDDEMKDDYSSSMEDTVLESSSSLTSSEDMAKNHVSFNSSVTLRVVYCDSDNDGEDDGEEEESEDSIVDLKKEDNSTPIMEAVHFDPAEEAIRSQLVGCISAVKRKKHNYAAMYGCGKPIRDDDDECRDDDDDDNDDDEDYDFTKPARVIVACAPSSSWFSF